jgi:hypothetical protein
MADKRELLLKVKVDDEASRPLKKIGDAADSTKDNLQEMNLGLKKLDGQVADTKKTISGLREEIAKTGDLDLIKDITKQEQRLKALARQRKALLGDDPVAKAVVNEDDGKRSGKKWLSGFRSEVSSGASQIGEALSGGLKAAPMEAKAAIAAIVVAGAVVAAPTVGAMVSGAVLAGLGGGAVAAGVAAALQDPAVKAAGAGLGADLRNQMLKAGDAFKEPTLAAISEVRGQMPGIGSALRDALEPAAGYVLPLTRGFTGLVKNVIPGLAAGIKAAEPVIAVMERRLPAIGRAVSDAFAAISENGDNAAAGFETVLRLVEGTVRVGGAVVAWLTDAYDWVLKIQLAAGMAGEKFLGWVPGLGGQIRDFNTTTAEMLTTAKGVGDAGKDSGQKMASGWLEAARAAGDASKEVETLASRIERLTSANIDSERSNIALESAIDRATEAGRKNNDGIDAGTEKGRANRQLLIDLAAASNKAAADIMTQTGSQELANAAAQRGREAFIASAMSMGVSAGKAKELADKLFGIPTSVTTTVTANTAPALAAAKGIVARINSMKARISVYAEPSGGFGGSKDTGFGYSTGYAAGGRITGLPGPKGVDSGYIKAANDEHVLTAEEVDAAGGHAAIEAWRRSLRSGQKAMAGASGGGSASTGGGTQTVVVRFDTTGSDRSILGAFIRAIRDAGGDPTALGV